MTDMVTTPIFTVKSYLEIIRTIRVEDLDDPVLLEVAKHWWERYYEAKAKNEIQLPKEQDGDDGNNDGQDDRDDMLGSRSEYLPAGETGAKGE